MLSPKTQIARARIDEDRRWLAVMAAVTTLELGWWATAWGYGVAPPVFVAGYLLLAFTGLASALALRLALRQKPACSNWPVAILGTILSGIGASAFLPLKYAIPKVMPFWLDGPLAAAERQLFGGDPWLLLDGMFGFATVPMDWLYSTWLPVQSLVMFLVMLAQPSVARSRALIS